MVRLDAAGDSGGRTAAERKAENRDGERRSEVLELLEGRLGVQFALDPIDATCAPAISGVIEDKRGDTVGGQKLLHGKPAANGFSNAVTDEDCCTRRACSRLRKYCVKDILSAGDGMP